MWTKCGSCNAGDEDQTYCLQMGSVLELHDPWKEVVKSCDEKFPELQIEYIETGVSRHRFKARTWANLAVAH